MCTVDTLQKMSEINANIIHLNVDRLKRIGQEDVHQLRALPVIDELQKNPIQSMQLVVSEPIRQRINDTFRMILALFQTNDPNDFSVGKNFLDSLKEIVVGFPSYTKEQMGEDTRKLYEQTKSVLSQNAQGLFIESLISCREALFKD